MQLQQAVNDFRSQYHQDIEYRVRNGVPNRLTLRNDVTRSERMKADLGLFIQDQWTIDRMTLNLGVRFEYLNSYVPEQTLAADRWSPARSFERVERVPEWRDINPRLGLAYDLFGDSRTALKVSAGRYVGLQTVQLAGRNNPINTSFNSVNREWKDANDNFVPDCDLLNPAANGECGRFQNLQLGQSNPNGRGSMTTSCCAASASASTPGTRRSSCSSRWPPGSRLPPATTATGAATSPRPTTRR